MTKPKVMNTSTTAQFGSEPVTARGNWLFLASQLFAIGLLLVIAG